ncbi:hypothetical protein NKH77_29115 [Streptomyces sp. M19]
MPYHAQWESADLVPAILAGTLDAADDPLWQKSGAASPRSTPSGRGGCAGGLPAHGAGPLAAHRAARADARRRVRRGRGVRTARGPRRRPDPRAVRRVRHPPLGLYAESRPELAAPSVRDEVAAGGW